MRFLSRLPLRLCAWLLLLSCLWTLCGAPIHAAQWQAIPANLRRVAVQLPTRMGRILQLWLSSEVALPTASAETRQVELPLLIWDHTEQCAMSLQLEDYVYAATAAEMPAAYPLEALKAQAVAARTRAVWACRALGGNGCASHPECDLCTDPACCQAWLDDPALQARWGSEYALYASRVTQAVQATAGQILTYEGLPVQMVYHACSGGQTEDAAAVFAQAVPYLISVPSPGEESATAYQADVTYTLAEAAAMLNTAFPDCHVTAEGFSGQVRRQSSTASGRIATILVGNTVVTGSAFRQALNLRSTAVTWETHADTVTFHTIGYGHGVGMSQAGASAMAANGSTCPEILMHYYPGTAISLLPVMYDFLPNGAD